MKNISWGETKSVWCESLIMILLLFIGAILISVPLRANADETELDSTDTLTIDQYINDLNDSELEGVTYGDSYTLKADASSTYCDKQDIKYEWYVMNEDWAEIPLTDEGGKEYGNVSVVTVKKSGTYKVVVSDGNKEKTIWFDLYGDDTLSVSSFINGKKNTTQYGDWQSEESAELKVDATSSIKKSEDITYQWLKYDVDGDEEYEIVQGADTDTYSVDMSDDKEEYCCKVSDGVTTLKEFFYLSKKNSLDVSGIVKANEEDVNRKEEEYQYFVKIGDTVKLSLKVTNNLAGSKLSYKWYNEDGDIVSTNSSYSFTKAEGLEKYSCVISNGTDEKTKDFYIDADTYAKDPFAIKQYINGKETDYLALDSFDDQEYTLKVEGTSSTGEELSYEWYDGDSEGKLLETSNTCKVDSDLLDSDYNEICCRVSDGSIDMNYYFAIYLKNYTENASIYIGDKKAAEGDTSITVYTAEGEKVILKVVPEAEKDTLTYTWYNKNGVKQGEGSSLEVTRGKAKETYICVVRDGSNLSKYYFTLASIQPEDCKHENIVTDEAAASTCTTDGKTEGSHCKDCGTVIKAQETVKATGHQWDAGTVTTPATATAKGVKTYMCTVCKATKTEEIPAADNSSDSSTADKPTTNNTVLTVGAFVTDKKSKAVYKVTGKNTMEYKSASKKAVSVNIPSYVTVNGVKYQVTSIAVKAFKGNKKLKKVVIPATIRKIGKQAFYGCKNLKKITIKTKYLTKKNVGAKAFKGIHAKATIKVPKKQLKSYKKVLKAKGVGKKVKIKK